MRRLNPARVVLYGSRARGDASPVSDFDIAFVGVADRQAWLEYVVEMDDAAPCIYGLDLVRYEEVGDALRASIDQEGVSIYEAST